MTLVVSCLLGAVALATADAPTGSASPSAAPCLRPCEAAAEKLFGRTPPPIGGEIREPKKTRNARISYPKRKAPPAGSNIFSWAGEILIDPNGAVREVFVTRDFSFEPPWPEFSAAVPRAVRQWRFTPTLVDGAPVPICMAMTVSVHW